MTKMLLVLVCSALIVSCDSGYSMSEVDTTNLCHNTAGICGWGNLCRNDMVYGIGGGVYRVEKVELNDEKAVVLWDETHTPRDSTVAYISMSLVAPFWGSTPDTLTAKRVINTDCNQGSEDESYYTVGDEIAFTLRKDEQWPDYFFAPDCLYEQYLDKQKGTVVYDCIGRSEGGFTVEKIQSIFASAKNADGTYDCAKVLGTCDSYWTGGP